MNVKKETLAEKPFVFLNNVTPEDVNLHVYQLSGAWFVLGFN